MLFLALSGAPLIILTIIAFVFVIGIIVALHEYGHFLAATKFDVMCYEYSIGYGPLIYKKKGKKTQFSVRAIPLGGYVAMAGEDILGDDIKKEESVGVNLDQDNKVTEIILDTKKDAMVRGKCTDIDMLAKDGGELYITLTNDTGVNYFVVNKDASYVFEKNSRMQIAPYEKSVDAKAWWKKAIIYVAGPLMNFVLAIFLYIIICLASGVANLESSKIGEVGEGYAAYEVLENGDEIVGLNGKTITSWTEFSNVADEIYKTGETTLEFKVKRTNESGTSEILTKTIESWTGINSIGLSNFWAKNSVLSTIPTTSASGLELGNLAIRYKTSPDSKYEYKLAAGDYLTAIKIDSTVYDVSAMGDNAWGNIALLFTSNEITTGAHTVTFSYYHKVSDTEYHFVSCDDETQGIAEPYTAEVLKSQSVDIVRHLVGINSTTKFDFFQSIGNAFAKFWNDFTLIFRTLKLIIAPSDVRQIGVNNLSSVVGIFATLQNYVAAGFLQVLAFAALLSTNLGVVNLLPIPALDGGKIVFAFIEAITKKRIPKKVEIIINLVFYVLLFALLIYVTYNDILRLVI